MYIPSIAVIACWALCAAGLAAYAVGVAQEITYVTLADGRKTERRLPLVFRLLLPFAPNMSRIVSRPSFDRSREMAVEMIVSAGLEGLLTGNEFLALKYLTPVVLGGAWVALVALMCAVVPDSFLADSALPIILLGLLVFFWYPLAWLRGARAKRHFAIVRALPFVLDLLTLSVEAGMDFMSALQRNCECRKMDPLNEELLRMVREIQVGTPRRIALKNMSERVRQGDLKSVTTALIQADELGVSIGTILRIQSEQLRSRRFERAEKLANEAPVKMLFPLLLFIFPAVFVVLLGPIISQSASSIF